MAASSPLGDSFVWKTTPKEPLPTILHWVYARSLYSPVTPSWTFSRMISGAVLAAVLGVDLQMGETHHPFSERKRPMAGSGSLYGERVERGCVCQGRGQRAIAAGGRGGRRGGVGGGEESVGEPWW